MTLGACSTDPKAFSASSVGQGLQAKTGLNMPADTPIKQTVMPDRLSLEQELDVNQLALIALWNNANFKTLLVDIKLAQADLVQAGLLPNPELMYSFPVSNKVYKYALEMPIEAIWLRPIKLDISRAEAERVNQTLQQAGLDLIRDIRQAAVELVMLRRQSAIQARSSQLREEIAALTEKRLLRGDISEPELLVKQVDASRASQEAQRLHYETQVAEQKLLLLLGLQGVTRPLALQDISAPSCELKSADLDGMITTAMHERPDAAAAQLNLAAAELKHQLAKYNWLRVLGIADATSGQSKGHELSPAMKFTLPLFNWNQGGRNRASADIEKAQRSQHALAQQIDTEIRQQFSRVTQSCEMLATLNKHLKPQAQQAESLAIVALDKGDISYLQMLESKKQVIDVAIQQAALEGGLYKSWAELDRSSGHQLSRPSTPDPTRDAALDPILKPMPGTLSSLSARHAAPESHPVSESHR